MRLPAGQQLGASPHRVGLAIVGAYGAAGGAGNGGGIASGGGIGGSASGIAGGGGIAGIAGVAPVVVVRLVERAADRSPSSRPIADGRLWKVKRHLW